MNGSNKDKQMNQTKSNAYWKGLNQLAESMERKITNRYWVLLLSRGTMQHLKILFM